VPLRTRVLLALKSVMRGSYRELTRARRRTHAMSDVVSPGRYRVGTEWVGTEWVGADRAVAWGHVTTRQRVAPTPRAWLCLPVCPKACTAVV
jgi:hypothetical protein